MRQPLTGNVVIWSEPRRFPVCDGMNSRWAPKQLSSVRSGSLPPERPTTKPAAEGPTAKYFVAGRLLQVEEGASCRRRVRLTDVDSRGVI